MKIRFEIEYRTLWGEDLRVRLWPIGKSGQRTAMNELRLVTEEGVIWTGEMNLDLQQPPKGDVVALEYQYAMWRDGQLVWTEWEVAPHRVVLDGITNQYLLTDKWRPIPEDLPLFSSAYTECVGAGANFNANPNLNPNDNHNDNHNLNANERGEAALSTLYPSTLQLRIVEPRLRKGEWLALCGSTPQLGEWQRAKRMALINLQEWAINIDADMLFDEAEYKYVVVDAHNNILRWEDGENRRLRCPKLPARQMWIKTDKGFRVDRADSSTDKWKVAGVVIPVFSLRSSKSYGVGDFGDLKALIQWAVKTHLHAIQILPINDTTTMGSWQDSYPYNAISIFALHPLYCNLSALPKLNDRLAMETFMIKQQQLNALKVMDYEQVIALKMDYLRRAYAQEGKKVLEEEGFKTFFAGNKDWLIPYAAFSYLRDQYQTAEFGKWPKYSHYNKREVEKLVAKSQAHYDQVAFFYYVQYQLHKQLLEVRNEARKNGVIIKGDIPIGISRSSVEAWSEPHLFNLDGQAGAPPDDFSTNGQNWGFPTYNWEAMAKDGYRWWIRRFQKMAEYFDAYRIDHVLGFFRIWDIPMHSVHGLLGQFSPSLPMSVEEIEHYGMRFNAELMTRPYITDYTLDQIFGYRKELVKSIYLKHRSDGRYDMKDEYANQRMIEAAFAGKTDADSLSLRDGLYALVSCVLFVPDRKKANMYHPRISAKKDYIYQSLLPHEQEAFDRLYEDYFYKRHNRFWYDEAMKKLPALTQSTRMLVCAEDLGMVPESVGWVMNDLRILSLEIQSMPKSPWLRFGHLWENPYRSVATISTHDMPPLRQWWDEDMERAQEYYNTALYKDGAAPHPAPGWLCEEIVSAHLFCPSALTLLSLQDWLSMDEKLRLADPNGERINIPVHPRHYWQWRMHLSIEQLIEAKEFNELVKSMVVNSGRG